MGLLDFFSSKPPPQPQGLLGQAAQGQNLRDQWMAYQEKMMVNGQKPLPFAEWAKQQQAPQK